jgi:enoyl-[acyl-carrier-protein] reductase (NADH)
LILYKSLIQHHCSAEEVAGTAVYFSSKAGAYATGQIVVIDGGYLAVNPARA